MENIEERIKGWSDRAWKGCTTAELRAACQHLQINIKPSDTLEGLTLKLLEHEGRQPNVASKGPLAPSRETNTLQRMPELRSLVNWGGRRRRVHAVARSEEQDGDEHFHVSWEGHSYRLDPKLPHQDVPWPVYQIMRNAVTANLRTKWLPETQTMDRWWVRSPRYPFEDLGTTPGTEHLPVDARDWFIAHAQANDTYAGWNKDQLERVWTQLTDLQRPNAADRDRNADHWRREILQLLGLTPEQLEPQEQAA